MWILRLSHVRSPVPTHEDVAAPTVLFYLSHSGGLPMANKEQRSSREKRKPKKEKPKPAQHVSSFSPATSKSSAGKKPG
jgi:hypothetical protein